LASRQIFQPPKPSRKNRKAFVIRKIVLAVERLNSLGQTPSSKNSAFFDLDIADRRAGLSFAPA
jgi:hypothetical protein